MQQFEFVPSMEKGKTKKGIPSDRAGNSTGHRKDFRQTSGFTGFCYGSTENLSKHIETP